MQNPEIFVKGNVLSHRDAIEMMPKYLKLIRWRCSDDETILDVGCGSGDITWNYLRPQIPNKVRILGADIGKNMLAYAEKTYPNVHFFPLDITSTNLPKNLYSVYDHVFSSHCLMCTREQRQALQNIYDMLKPNGDLFTYYLGTHPFFDVFLNSSNLLKWNKYISDPFSYYSIYQNVSAVETQEQVNKMLIDIGFEVTLCEVLIRKFVCPNLIALRTYMSGVHPQYSKIPESLKEEFIDDSINELLKLRVIKEANIKNSVDTVLPHTLIVIVAKKLNI